MHAALLGIYGMCGLAQRDSQDLEAIASQTSRARILKFNLGRTAKIVLRLEDMHCFVRCTKYKDMESPKPYHNTYNHYNTGVLGSVGNQRYYH